MIRLAIVTAAAVAVVASAEPAQAGTAASTPADSAASAPVAASPAEPAVSAPAVASPAEPAAASAPAVSTPAEPAVSAPAAASPAEPAASIPQPDGETAVAADSESGTDTDTDIESDADGLAQSEDDIDSPEVAGPSAPPPVEMIRLGRPGRLDGIAAVVGSEIILHSELEAYAYMRLAAMGGDPGAVDVRELLRISLEELIDNKVLLVRAVEDSAITVRADEIESMLNNHITNIMRQNNLNMDRFEEALRVQQGTTLARFKSEMRRAIREQLYKQKLQQRYYFSTNVNRRDVERFFAEYRDSLPELGESFELHKLSLRLASSDSVRQAAFDRIRAIKRQLDAGGNFAELAAQHSESPEGPSGGSLGYLEKGSTTEIVFEEHAFSLPVGRAGEPFETRLGFHILLVEEKRDRRVKLSQILVRHAPTEQQREALVARLDSLRQSVRTTEEFEAAAKAMSADAATRTRGGAMGWLSLFEMTPPVRNAVMSLEPGQISAPVTEENMISVYKLTNRVDNRKLTMENDYPAIAEKARDIAAQKQLLESVKRWRERVFIDIRI